MELAAFIIFIVVMLYEIIKSLLDSVVTVKSLKKQVTSAPAKKRQTQPQPQKKVIYNTTYNIIVTDYNKLKDKQYFDIK